MSSIKVERSTGCSFEQISRVCRNKLDSVSGSVYSDRHAPSYDECQLRCQFDSRCAGFEFHEVRKNCELHSEIDLWNSEKNGPCNRGGTCCVVNHCRVRDNWDLTHPNHRCADIHWTGYAHVASFDVCKARCASSKYISYASDAYMNCACHNSCTPKRQTCYDPNDDNYINPELTPICSFDENVYTNRGYRPRTLTSGLRVFSLPTSTTTNRPTTTTTRIRYPDLFDNQGGKRDFDALGRRKMSSSLSGRN